MNNSIKLLIGALASMAIYNEIACEVNRRKIIAQNGVINRLCDQNNFLANKLDEAKVPMSEFDKIVMKNFL